MTCVLRICYSVLLNVTYTLLWEYPVYVGGFVCFIYPGSVILVLVHTPSVLDEILCPEKREKMYGLCNLLLSTP